MNLSCARASAVAPPAMADRRSDLPWPAWMVLLLALLLAACAGREVVPPEPVEGEHSLEIEVRGLECCPGALRVALYNGSEYWLEDGAMVRGQAAPVLEAPQVVEFSGLPPGGYAVALFHDRNANTRFDRLLGLVPREPYGFSNNPDGMGRPSFEDAAVPVPETSRIVIDLRPPPF